MQMLHHGGQPILLLLQLDLQLGDDLHLNARLRRAAIAESVLARHMSAPGAGRRAVAIAARPLALTVPVQAAAAVIAAAIFLLLLSVIFLFLLVNILLLDRRGLFLESAAAAALLRQLTVESQAAERRRSLQLMMAPAAVVVHIVVVAVVRLVLLETPVAAVGLAAVAIASFATIRSLILTMLLLLLLLLAALDDHVEGDGVLGQLQLCCELLLLGLQLLEDGGGLGAVALLEEVGLLEDVELELLHEVRHLAPR